MRTAKTDPRERCAAIVEKLHRKDPLLLEQWLDRGEQITRAAPVARRILALRSTNPAGFAKTMRELAKQTKRKAA